MRPPSFPRATPDPGRVLPVLVLAMALAAPGAVTAQAPSVRAYLTPDGPVGVGRPFVLNVEISGTREVESEPTLPDLSGFSQYLGSSSQSSARARMGRASAAPRLATK